MGEKYFAYGSNLNAQQMSVRCPQAVPVQKGYLRDYNIAFTRWSKNRNCGVADVVPELGQKVWGLVWNLPTENLEMLDSHEGHPKHYKRQLHEIFFLDGSSIQAWVYEVNKKQSFCQPSKEYVDTILSEGKALSFPEKYLESVKVISRI